MMFLRSGVTSGDAAELTTGSNTPVEGHTPNRRTLAQTLVGSNAPWEKISAINMVPSGPTDPFPLGHRHDE